MTRVSVTPGFGPEERAQIAQFYWDAFGGKLGRVMGPDRRALPFLQEVMDPTHALCARDESGLLLGVVGFKTYESTFVGGGYTEMAKHYGRFGAMWRIFLLGLLERDVENQRFVMDGIFVAPHARGLGVGTALLDAICREATTRGYKEIRLDVIDSNPRARALYDREGFVAGGVHNLGPLRYIFGFASATTMIRRL